MAIATVGARALAFGAIGGALYLGTYWMAEQVASAHPSRNRFHAIASRPPTDFDLAILGASHAAVLGYRDLTSQLETRLGGRIINLSITGGGIIPNRLLVDYLRTRHRVRALVYVADSFAFSSRQWNEDRLADVRLFAAAPFDLELARLLLRTPATWLIGIDYVSGFSKINNPDRWVADDPPEEGGRFDRAYRPVAQLDQERLRYLYPGVVDAVVLDRYLAELEALIVDARREGVSVGVIKPPLPLRVRVALPDEPAFDRRLTAIAARNGARFADFSDGADDARHFADTDHLNRNGVLAFFERLVPWIVALSAGTDARR